MLKEIVICALMIVLIVIKKHAIPVDMVFY